MRLWNGRLFILTVTTKNSRSRTADPKTFAMVGWSTGTRMVAVDVAIAYRGPGDVAGWSEGG